MVSTPLTWALIVVEIAGLALLNIRNDILRYTPIPEYVGSALYTAESAREMATFTAQLLARDPDAQLSVPVLGVARTDIADSYGAARSGERSHEGTDIFAPRGTYIVSATDGIVARVGTNTLGGNIVFIIGPGGERFYYAHFDEIESTLVEGMRVSTSTILGRVGTSGNALGTPPHLHFGIYTSSGPINPYPRLRAPDV